MPSLPHLSGTFIDYFDLFLGGMWVTIKLTAVSIFIALIIGLVFALFKISNIKVLDWIANVYIWLVRGTPLIVQIFVLYFGLQAIISLTGFWAATWALAFHSGAYIAEIIRGAIQSIDNGQREAGRSLGMSLPLTMRRIILPQAFRRAIPPLSNQFIIGLKDSSLAAFVGIPEIFNISTTQAATNFDPLTFYIISAVYYLFLVFVFTLASNALEKRLASSD
ncbi:MAG TPA: amino acid ABC transporter permease [Bacillales bacterium]